MSKSSGRWLKEHFSDPYVKKSWEDGYRSRAAYKLTELQKKYRFIKPNMRVVDLGAAPGSWSQVAVQHIGKRGTLIALDLLEIDPIPNVTFLQGDFTEETAYQKLIAELGDQAADLILSDMAPNMSGNKTSDQINSLALTELAYDFAKNTLALHGHFVSKVFQGPGLDQLIRAAKLNFTKVHLCKPDASRDRSPEHFLVCLDFKKGCL
ncbi:MAG: RlmE family RNA methyltransferase [Gammaproteobacteria bacterium]|nr:RlmE family RNA methyltransferase [Gammaproteobacteria bacterium]